MTIQELIIHVLVTLVGIGILFFYFKTRLARTEQKVDLMFQLIQEHERHAQMRLRNPLVRTPDSLLREDPETNLNDVKDAVGQRDGLINISDDDESNTETNFDSDDSQEVSDHESDRLLISQDEHSLENTNKIIPLSLDGAEVGQSSLKMADISILNEHLVEDADIDDDALLDSNGNDDNLDTIELSDTDEDSKEFKAADLNGDGVIDEDEFAAHLAKQDNAKSAQVHESSVNDTDKLVKVKKEDVEETPVDYSKMTVAELKAKASEKGLTHYKALRKPKLVELLNSVG